MPAPFMDKIFTFTQPDGTKFKVRGTGDQGYAVFETLDGYTVVKNPNTGFYEIAQISDDGTMLEPASAPQGNLDATRAGAAPGVRIDHEAARARGMEGVLRMGGRRCDLRREQRKNLSRARRNLDGPVMAPPQRDTVGDFVGLCLLIDFSDELGTITKEEVEKFCNEENYSGFGNKGSVYDYFLDNSIGRCRYTNIVAEYYRAKHPKSYYTDPNISQGIRARELIVEALAHLEANHFDFTALTADSDGFVYAMNVYYAGEVVNNWAEGLWPHAWHLAAPVELAVGKSAFDYQFTDMSHELSLGTFCHENGHMLCDYPDLYDYGSESSGAGAYCLMCAGGNIDEKNPTHISAYLKRMSGWAKSVVSIQPNQHIALAAGKNEFAIFSKDSGEYFIIENRQKSGRDVSLPDEGLAIWHVDEDGSNSNEQMTPGKHYELSLEQADGNFDLERSRHYGDSGDLFGETNKRFSTSTTPNSLWWDGTVSNLDMSEITHPNSTVSFKTTYEGNLQAVQGESTPAIDIPDNRADGIFDSIVLSQDANIIGVEVTLDISHTYRGDLQVTLLTPWGVAIVLHQRNEGGSSDNIQKIINESDLQTLSLLHGHSTKGAWMLQVQDLAPADVGILNHWALKFTVASPSQGKVVLEEVIGVHIPDDDPVGIIRTLSSSATGNIASVEISVDIVHTWIEDLQISLRSPSGTDVILHDNVGGSNDNIMETYTETTTPLLGTLVGQPIDGEWQLQVSDQAGQDVGKLNSWRVVIHPEQ
ncbi:MAG: hypothetical protein COB07_05400 [Sulfurovum sp.]|nr:MAG: hypothetical protein COB07_05400 [Sulfurovum sp.]